MIPDTTPSSFFGRSRELAWFTLLLVLAAGFGLRLLKLDSVIEMLPRLAWLGAGIVLFGIARRFAGLDGALTGLAVFVVTPYTITLSGSNPPNAYLLLVLLIALYSLQSWSERGQIGWALGAGVAGCITVLIKSFAVYPLLLGLVLSTLGKSGAWDNGMSSLPAAWRKAVTERPAWLIAALLAIGLIIGRTIVPRLGYDPGPLLAASRLAISPAYYLRWLGLTNRMIAQALLFTGLAGLVCFNGRGRALAASLWIGTFLIGACLSKLATDDLQYSLFLIPAVALSLAPLADLFFSQLRLQTRFWQIAFSVFALLALAYPAWVILYG